MVRLELIELIYDKTEQSYFNSSMVRLELPIRISYSSSDFDFNSSMVRLEYDGELMPIPIAPEFQFLNGAIRIN